MRIEKWQVINDRLKAIRHAEGYSQALFAKKLDLPQNTYCQYEIGKRSIPDVVKIKLSSVEGINLHWLLTGMGPMYLLRSDETVETRGCLDTFSDFMANPMSSARFQSDGCSEDADQITKYAARRYSQSTNFSWTRIKGDSMEPTLHDGEQVVFAKGVVSGDGIYVLSASGNQIVKRLEFNRISGKLRIISDNPKYSTSVVDQESHPEIAIQGKVVVWVHEEQ
jgi:phage repressor protein C with HTH and peptisase S24 domain